MKEIDKQELQDLFNEWFEMMQGILDESPYASLNDKKDFYNKALGRSRKTIVATTTKEVLLNETI